MAEIIYQLIDGKLIPKPGNQRDSTRRYAGLENSTNGDRRVREFTNEEELARDVEEAKWEAERPQREARKKEAEHKQQEFVDSLKYQDRLVAFLDVLGWSEAIKKSALNANFVKTLGLSSQVFTAYQTFVQWQQDHGEWPGDPRLSQFSDCILLSAVPDMHGRAFITNSIRTISNALLDYGLLIRGGVTQGQLYHHDNTVFGPAIVEAHNLEKYCAKYPRVIVEEKLANTWTNENTYCNKDGSLLGYGKIWRKSQEDEWMYFDFLQPIAASTFTKPNEYHLKNTLITATTVAKRGIENYENKDEKIYQKYVWLAKYINSLLLEYPQINLPKIDH